jgi:HYPK UBA domain
MAEPLPSASNAAEVPDNEETARLPKNAEDRKAAAALNSLNANEISQDETAGTSSKQPSAADQEALGKAMSRLEIASGTGGRKDAEKKSDKKAAEAEVKKKVKIASEDVNLLVSALRCPLRVLGFYCTQVLNGWQVDELDLSKVKATELLRAHEGDAMKAIRAFILPSARAWATPNYVLDGFFFAGCSRFDGLKDVWRCTGLAGACRG